MSRKAAVEPLFLILIVAVSVVGIIFVFSLISKGYGEMCKRAQMDELNKIWRELRYWENRESISPGGSNVIPDFKVENCVSEITYNKTSGKLKVKWTDNSEDKMPAMGEWLLCKPLPPGTYHVRVSFKKVEVIGFCEPCRCNKDNNNCNKSECIGSVICGDSGICSDGKFYPKNCRISFPEDCFGYCVAYCKNKTRKEGFSKCWCNNNKKCEVECKPEEIPDMIPEDRDAWTEDLSYLDDWYARVGDWLEKEMSDDSKVNSHSVHVKGNFPRFSIYKALNNRYVYLPDFNKLHFWLNASENGEDLTIVFDTKEDFPYIKGLECHLGDYKKGWREYTIVLNPDLNPNCEWTSELRCVKDIVFTNLIRNINAEIDGLYLCENC